MPRRWKELVGVAALVVAIASIAIFVATASRPTSTQARVAAWPPRLPVPRSAVDLPERRSLALHGWIPDSTAPTMDLGTVWASDKGPGFGRHRALEIFRLADPAWLLVLAESGLWFVETETLARRARLRTGVIASVDVSPDGKRIAYASCAAARGHIHDLRRSSSDSNEACALVVLEFPSLTEIAKGPIKGRREVRFSSDGRALAKVEDGIEVLPLDGDRQPWSAGRSAVSAIAFGETRVAYLSASGHLVIEDRMAAKAVFERGTTVATTGGLDLGFVKFGGSEHFSGTLYYDASRDRLVAIGRGEALVVEQASGASPKFTRGVDVATVEAVARPRAIGFDQAELARRFGLNADVWKLHGPLGRLLFGPHDEALWIADGYVARIDRRGITRSADFGPVQDRWEADVGGDDMVLYMNDGHRTHVQRVPLAPPRLDALPVGVGDFENERGDAAPLSFSNGDRFFVAVDADGRAGLVRLPIGGALGSLTSLDAKAPSFSQGLVPGPDRWAYVGDDRHLVEIARDRALVLERDVASEDKLSWDAPRGCWALTPFSGAKRFVGCP